MLTVGPDSAPFFPEGMNAKLTHAQFECLNTLSRAAFAQTNYDDLFRVLGDFARDIGAGAVNCAVFDNNLNRLIGVSSTMKPQSIDRYFSENLAIDDPLIPRIHIDPQPALLGWGFGVTPAWQRGNSARMLEAMNADGYHGLAYFPVVITEASFSTSITFRNELEPERGQAFLNSEYGLLQLASIIIGQRAAALFRGTGHDGNWYSFANAILSPRECEILRYLASGLRTERIAYQLGVKPVTVHMHLRSARRKLGAQTREQLMALAVRYGLL